MFLKIHQIIINFNIKLTPCYVLEWRMVRYLLSSFDQLTSSISSIASLLVQ